MSNYLKFRFFGSKQILSRYSGQSSWLQAIETKFGCLKQKNRLLEEYRFADIHHIVERLRSRLVERLSSKNNLVRAVWLPLGEFSFSFVQLLFRILGGNILGHVPCP